MDGTNYSDLLVINFFLISGQLRQDSEFTRYKDSPVISPGQCTVCISVLLAPTDAVAMGDVWPASVCELTSDLC